MPQGRPEGRRQRHKRELRTRILATARELLAERGSEVTVAEIARAADVAEKTFYNHCGSRAELLAELAHEQTRALIERVERARKRPGTTRARLSELCREIGAPGADLPGRVPPQQVTTQLLADPPARGEPDLEQALVALLEDGIERGDVGRAVDVEFVAGVAAAGIEAARRAAAARPDYPLRVRMEQLADLLGTAIEGR